MKLLFLVPPMGNWTRWGSRNKTYGVKALSFLDDDFNSDRGKMVELLDELEKRDLDIEWFFMGRAAI